MSELQDLRDKEHKTGFWLGCLVTFICLMGTQILGCAGTGVQVCYEKDDKKICVILDGEHFHRIGEPDDHEHIPDLEE